MYIGISPLYMMIDETIISESLPFPSHITRVCIKHNNIITFIKYQSTTSTDVV